ncbi:MAG: hypothetical protein LBH21_08620 [Gracilibacteraceae bacterium]|jgi:hypothetical protein|nr:hypothetical protein [Gracilibacteraceae bacterium]
MRGEQGREPKIDGRDAAALRARIKTLAAAYTPEWDFSEDNPDAGSVIAMIFAKQMEDNIRRLNRVFDKLHAEFVNMLDLSPQPARPARGAAVFTLGADTVDGVDLPAGTKLLGLREESEAPLVFETASDLHVTNVKLRDLIGVFPAAGKVVSYMGAARRVRLAGESGAAAGEGADGGGTGEAGEAGEEFVPFRLFDSSAPPIGRNALVFYHRNLFDLTAGASISAFLRPARAGNEALFADRNRYRWSCLTESGLRPLAAAAGPDGAVVLTPDADTVKIERNGVMYSLIVLEAAAPVRESLELLGAGFSSSCQNAAPSFVTHNADDMDPAAFMPFGATASLYDECYIGGGSVFSKQNAVVTLSFNLGFREKLVTFTPEAENSELKIIKRRPAAVALEAAHTAAERVTAEYFNGAGWRRLLCSFDVAGLFAGEAGRISFDFICPPDWRPLTVGGHSGHCLRLRIMQADNCYLQPCLHRMPMITDMTFAYRFPAGPQPPDRLERVSGVQITDLTASAARRESFIAFAPPPYGRGGLYLGFDRRPAGAPVSLLFDIERGVCSRPNPFDYAYSSPAGFRPLRLIDNIGDLSGPGTLQFIPPPDWTELEVEGVRRYWLRLTDKNGALAAPAAAGPLLSGISLNAAEILNIETLPPEPYFIDSPRPHMSFPLPAGSIVSVEVFVNERHLHTAAAARRLAAARPADVRMSVDTAGEISEFFVRWHEVENFANSGPADRHYRIDRRQNRIVFGDGVRTPTPSAGVEEAFNALVRRSRGAEGNLPAASVTESLGRLLHIDGITNPLATWAGSDMENADRMRSRGANLICSQNRLRSAADFLREARLYSDAVADAACAAGVDLYGRPAESMIHIAVLTKDFHTGAFAFTALREGLEKRILAKCDAMVARETLAITEPVYVELSVAVLVEVAGEQAAFAARRAIVEALDAFIAPLTPDGSLQWPIGVLPTETRIRLLLHSLRLPANIRHIVVTARFVDDGGGLHERSLPALRPGPFMIGVNGRHTVHLARRG